MSLYQYNTLFLILYWLAGLAVICSAWIPPGAARIRLHHLDQSRNVCYSSIGTNDDNNVPRYNLVVEYDKSETLQLQYAFWITQEILTTFTSVDSLAAVTIKPSNQILFAVQSSDDYYTVLNVENEENDDRFIEPKYIKQQLRDIVSPQQSLGHSDAIGTTADSKSTVVNKPLILDSQTESTVVDPVTYVNELVSEYYDNTTTTTTTTDNTSNHLFISYCNGCKWLLRATFYAQSMASTVLNADTTVSFIPNRVTGGSLVITLAQTDSSGNVANNLIWDRRDLKRFPTLAELSSRISALLDGSDNDNDNTDMDDIEAEDARKYFGVM